MEWVRWNETGIWLTTPGSADQSPLPGFWE
jgi:hypothetical protein